MWSTLGYHVSFGRHGNDSTHPPSNSPHAPIPPMMLSLPKKELETRLQEALNHPDIKYNTKWYSSLKYPMKSPNTFDQILESFHPRPIQETAHNITLPIYIGTPWVNKIYIWVAFSAWKDVRTPPPNKKLILYPPDFPSLPYTLSR